MRPVTGGGSREELVENPKVENNLGGSDYKITEHMVLMKGGSLSSRLQKAGFSLMELIVMVLGEDHLNGKGVGELAVIEKTIVKAQWLTILMLMKDKKHRKRPTWLHQEFFSDL